MAEHGESVRRKTRMKVRQAQAEILALLPEMEALAARFQAISDQLAAGNHTDRFFDGCPGPDHLRYWVACDARETASDLRRLAEEAREGAQETQANLVASWKEKQKRKVEVVRRPFDLPYFPGLR